MKLRFFVLIASTIMGAGALFAGESKSPWHSFVGVQGGLYNSSDASLGVVEGGLGYEAGPLIHYLFIGAGQVSRDGGSTVSPWKVALDAEPDLQELEFGYRVAYRLNEKMQAFAELGAESFRGDSSATDILGNPVSFSFDSNHFFLGAGFQREVWNGINLDLSFRYLPAIDDAAFSRTVTDVLGNVQQVAGDTPNFLVKFGVSYCY